MKAKNIIEALRGVYEPLGTEWAFFEELRAGTGWSSIENNLYSPEQRFDAFVINLYPSKKMYRIAYEIKVSRSDFFHEIKNPAKREQALSLSNKYYFATPKGLVSIDEIPEECGLVEVFEVNGEFHFDCVKEAPHRETNNPNWQFVASIARRCMKAEGKLEGNSIAK